MSPRRAALAVGSAAVLLAIVTAGPALAAVQEGLGYSTAPSQPYLNNPESSDWLGSYTVNGEQTWTAQFGFLGPDSAEAYQPATPLMTKWGTALPTTVAADIGYLLWRYGGTSSVDDAAAVAHILNSWIAGPQNPSQLNPSNDFRHIAYDAPFHLSKLPTSAQTRVTEMATEAAALRGPWTVSITAPSAATIGTASGWEVRVLSAAATVVPSVPITFSVAGGTLASGATSLTFTTPADGAPLLVPVVPTSSAPAVTVDAIVPVDAPAQRPAVSVDVSSVVLRADNITTLTSGLTGSAVAAPAAPTLPATGSTVSWFAVTAALLLLITGAVLALRARPAASRSFQ